MTEKEDYFKVQKGEMTLTDYVDRHFPNKDYPFKTELDKPIPYKITAEQNIKLVARIILSVLIISAGIIFWKIALWIIGILLILLFSYALAVTFTNFLKNIDEIAKNTRQQK